MTLNQCTKAELIELIESMTKLSDSCRYYVNRALIELEHKKELRKIDEEDRQFDIYQAKMREYAELLEPYKNYSVNSLPDDVHAKAMALLTEAQDAFAKWNKLMERNK